jgi:hypothetical protein
MKVIMAILLLLACLFTQLAFSQYKPDDQVLYDSIVKHDSIFFDAYNNCDKKLDLYASYYDEDLEFYHDKGGFSASRKDMIDATERNICGKVRRELVAGSIEVYPIANYGAIEIGYHKFYNRNDPPDTDSRAGRFVVVWKFVNSQWKISRVISLH